MKYHQLKFVILFQVIVLPYVLSAQESKVKKENIKCYVKENSFIKIFDQGIGEEKPWYINDHCFIQGESGKWHLFGITHEEPFAPLEEDNFAHATADFLMQQPWEKQPFVLSVATEPPWSEIHLWAPHVIFFEGTYYMYYCAGGDSHTTYKIHLATSKDLKTWERHPENPMVVDGFDGRDPFILRVKDKWIMYYTANRPAEKGNHVVMSVVSDDLIHWKDEQVVFTNPLVGTYGGPTESPCVVSKDGKYYLFVCTNDPYDNTAAYESDSPFHWEYSNRVADIPAHCAEVIHTSDDKWYISRAGWARGGVYLAELFWKE